MGIALSDFEVRFREDTATRQEEEGQQRQWENPGDPVLLPGENAVLSRSGFNPPLGDRNSFPLNPAPAPFATLKGAPSAGKAVKPVPGGTLTIEWQVRK
jgi:hypothetical protein